MSRYVKRIGMTRALTGWLPPYVIPSGLRWLPWNDSLLDIHAEVKFLSFEGTIDAGLFANLRTLEGCRYLMNAIRGAEGFCREATWLLADHDGPIGCVQGVIEANDLGAIQNVGVLPNYRCQGYGALLVARALAGFRMAGAQWVRLEVSAGNSAALRVYRCLGFRPYNTSLRQIASAAPV